MVFENVLFDEEGQGQEVSQHLRMQLPSVTALIACTKLEAQQSSCMAVRGHALDGCRGY